MQIDRRDKWLGDDGLIFALKTNSSKFVSNAAEGQPNLDLGAGVTHNNGRRGEECHDQMWIRICRVDRRVAPVFRVGDFPGFVVPAWRWV